MVGKQSGPINKTRSFIRSIIDNTDIDEIHLFSDQPRYFIKKNKIEKANIVEKQISEPGKLKYFQYIFRQILTFLQMVKFKNITIYYFRYNSLLLIPILLKLFKVKNIFIEVNGIPNQSLLENSYSNRLEYLRKLCIFYFDKILFKNVDQIYTVSRSFKENLIKNYDIDKEIYVIENGYEENDIQSVINEDSKIKLNNNFRYIIYVGELALYAGIEFMLDAFTRFYLNYDIGKQTKLFIIGDGQLSDKVFKRIPSPVKNNIVPIIGDMPKKQLLKYIISSEIGIYTPSSVSYGIDGQRGGSPLKLVDYLSLGKPIIVPQSEYYTYVKNNKIGMLYEPENEDSFCNLLNELLENHDLLHLMQNNARNYAINKLQWSKTLLPLIHQIQIIY
jgi:glycosyltransferase involved in cell wall biosynthesis